MSPSSPDGVISVAGRPTELGTPSVDAATLSIENARLRAQLDEAVHQRRLAEEARRTSEELQARIVASSRDCIKVLDLDARLLFMNDGGMRALEICDFGPVHNSSWIEFWRGGDREAAREAVKAARTGELGHFVGYFPTTQTGAPKWWDVVVSPILNSEGQPDRLLAVSRDVTVRKQAEERERALLEINNAIISNLTQDELFRAVTRALRPLMPYDRSTMLLHQPGKDLLRLCVLESSVPSREFVGNLEIGFEETPAGLVFKSGKTLLRRDLETEREFPTEDRLLSEGIRSMIIAPLIARARVVGTLNLLSTKPNQYSEADAEFFPAVAAQVALAVENMNSYEEIATLKARLEAENIYLQEEIRTEHNFREIVGNSPPLLAVLHKVEQIAPTDAMVLIGGETGTGKELIARAIHDRSSRAGRPLVKVDCSAISAGLVESELFGHVKGAFTGAIERRVGRFQLADGGTIFLDEIGELPVETQAKLLRVLQEQEFEPVGSDRTARVNVRVIAATNRNLEEAVREGRFRSDLFYRLNVFPLYLPPLRDRRADIPQLVAFFLDRLAKKFGKELKGVSQATMDTFLKYAWPGNIRELQNVMERSVVLAQEPVLPLDPSLPQLDSPDRPPRRTDEVPAGRSPNSFAVEPSPAAPLSLQEVETGHICAVLEQTGGVIEGARGAASILKLHPNTLRSRMKKLGISSRRDTHEQS
jgi:formate hydrogenlyase transcriptional activator